MATLRIRVELYSDVGMPTAPVIGNIYPYDRSMRREERNSMRNLVVPAGGDAERWTKVQLPPGDYEVQVELPSGKVLSKDISTYGEAKPIDLVFETASPHEWLAAQYFQGNVGSSHHDADSWLARGLAKGDSVALTTSSDEPLTRGPIAPRAVVRATPVRKLTVNWSPDTVPMAPGEVTWEILHEIVSERLLPGDAAKRFLTRPHAGDPSLADPTFDFDRVLTYRFTLAGPAPSWDAPAAVHPHHDDEPQPRCYVVLANDVDARIVSAPVPWFDLEKYGKELPIELMSPLGSAGVTMAVRDPEMASVIGYLTSHALDEARMLVEKAEGMLLCKMMNPLGAAAGAYVMLQTDKLRGKQLWHDWVSNLYQWFPWIPDGAIAFAMLKLNQQTNDQDVNHALEATLQAYQRGLPFYSIGVRHLLDLLTMFVDDETFSTHHGELREALHTVSAIARRVNYQQPFTSVRLTRLADRGT